MLNVGARRMFSLKDKIAVITGGSSGIGKCTAERFARAGAKVVIAARSDARALAALLGGLYVQTDVSNEEQVRTLMEAAASRYGRIDILVNNAGTFTSAQPLTSRSEADMVNTFAVNTLGPLFGMKHAVRFMPPGSSIVNVSSIAAQTGLAEYADYAASKFALNGISQGAAVELGPKGIRVNTVCPATVRTPMMANADVGEAEAALCRVTSALGEIIEPEEVAALIHFLCADDCPKITGQALTIDAGISAGFSIGAYNAIMKAEGLG